MLQFEELWAFGHHPVVSQKAVVDAFQGPLLLS